MEEMASQTENPAPTHAAQVVCNAFVDQYYHILHQSPELVYRFYQDSSVLSRPEPSGLMTSVTTMQAINEKILSLDYKNFKAEIKTADAQESYEGGVVVLVTGFLTGTDNVRRKFTQSFFLAPQDKGYFVLNDVFRYSDENDATEVNPSLANGTNENAPASPLTPEPDPSQAIERSVYPATPSEEDVNCGDEVCDPSENEDGSVVEEVEQTVHSSNNKAESVVESISLVQEDAPKKSYASIVKVVKDSSAPPMTVVSTASVKTVPKNIDVQLVAPPPPPPASTPEAVISGNTISEPCNPHEEAEGYSIYIGGLPLSATPYQLEEEFKKFGPIKPNGIQVRSNKAQGFCFGFVEFELSSSMLNAVEASTIMIGGRQAFIEQKKTTSRAGGPVVGGRGRYPPGGRGNFRSDGFRGRGNFIGGRGYGRNDFGNRLEYSNRPRGSSGRVSDGYQRTDRNGPGSDGYQRVDRNGPGRNVHSGGGQAIAST